MDWATPQDFVDWLDFYFMFTLDVCASKKNHKLPRYFTEKDNGLAQPWTNQSCWMNPPYGGVIGEWMAKARFEAVVNGASTCCLVPSRTDTGWWQESVLARGGRLRDDRWDPDARVLWLEWEQLTVGIYHHDTRLDFERPGYEDGAPFPSSVIVFDPPTRILNQRRKLQAVRDIVLSQEYRARSNIFARRFR